MRTQTQKQFILLLLAIVNNNGSTDKLFQYDDDCTPDYIVAVPNRSNAEHSIDCPDFLLDFRENHMAKITLDDVDPKFIATLDHPNDVIYCFSSDNFYRSFRIVNDQIQTARSSYYQNDESNQSDSGFMMRKGYTIYLESDWITLNQDDIDAYINC